jgi:hypothetical protein
MHVLFTSELVGDEWSDSRPGPFTPGERAPCTHRIGNSVGRRAGLDDVEWRKILSLSGLELRPLGPPARSYTDCAIPAPEYVIIVNNSWRKGAIALRVN